MCGDLPRMAEGAVIALKNNLAGPCESRPMGVKTYNLNIHYDNPIPECYRQPHYSSIPRSPHLRPRICCLQAGQF